MYISNFTHCFPYRFDLYMRMLKKSMRQLRGLDLPVVPRSNVLLPGGEGSIEWDDGTTSSSSYLIPESYIEDAKERSGQESLARLAESTERLVEITNAWKESYGPMPAELQVCRNLLCLCSVFTQFL